MAELGFVPGSEDSIPIQYASLSLRINLFFPLSICGWIVGLFIFSNYYKNPCIYVYVHRWNVLYYSARAALTKCHTLGGYSTENYFLTVLEAGNLRSRDQTGWVSPEASLLGSQMAAFPLCPRMAFLPCACSPGVSQCIQNSFSYKDNRLGWIKAHPQGLILT